MYVYILQPYHVFKDFLLCRQMLRKTTGLLQQMKTAKFLSSFGKCCELFKGEEVTQADFSGGGKLTGLHQRRIWPLALWSLNIRPGLSRENRVLLSLKPSGVPTFLILAAVRY